MRESGVFYPRSDGSLAANRIPSFGEALADVALNFSNEGALGLIAIDASALAEIERSFGCEAHQNSLNALAALTADLIGDGLGIGDMILSGETGRNELLVLVFREPNEIDFYRRELPGLARALARGYRSPGHRIGYPYLRKEPTHTVYGYEALARGPEGSELHSPAALFASAEEEDLLFQLDCLCRQSGLDGARDFPRESKLFLNVRPTTIHDPNFQAEALGRTLERCNLRPSDVVFEISEQESIENFAIFREVRDYYGKLGFEIALDDVGVGYASLESVMELGPEYIKVDRAFVAGIDQDAARQELLRALQAVAEKINARIIGEGLDTLEELETLGRLGISFGQGWLFGKPHPLRSDT